MRPEVSKDYEWSRQFLPTIKEVLGRHLISEAPLEEDLKHATDLIVLRLEAIRIGCRIRRNKWFAPYGHEFTIRSDRPNGAQTELAKVYRGWGDYYIYGFAGAGDDHLIGTFVGNLDVFRTWFAQEWSRIRATHDPTRPVEDAYPGVEQHNWDGSASFRAFRIGDLPAEFLIGNDLPPRPLWYLDNRKRNADGTWTQFVNSTRTGRYWFCEQGATQEEAAAKATEAAEKKALQYQSWGLDV